MKSKNLALLAMMAVFCAIAPESQAGNLFFKQAVAPPSAGALSGDQMLLNGKKFRDQGAYSQAVQAFEQAVKERPKSYEAHLELSKTLALCGQDDRAMVEAFESLKLELKNPQARNLLGQLFLRKQSKCWKSSLAIFQRAEIWRFVCSNWAIAIMPFNN